MAPLQQQSRNGHFEISTQRLRLRQWRIEDRPAFAELTADPEVMAFFPAPLSVAESDALVTRMHDLIAANGFGFWAVENNASGECIGFVGLNTVTNFPFGDGVEIGWRLARKAWGQGYATEAALAARNFAFTELALDELIAFAVVANTPSLAVMRRIGLTDTGRNFTHPRVDPDSALSEHVLYALPQSGFEEIAKTQPHSGKVTWIATD